MTDKRLDLELEKLMQNLLEKYKPKFGRKEDLEIKKLLHKVSLKSTPWYTKNSMMTRIIYLLKELGYGDQDT